MNRPGSRNALSLALRKRLFDALRQAQADDDVDVVILIGADPVFCAGLDLKELGDTAELPDISPKWPPMSKPVTGAINGAAVTGGLEIALYCDILIASELARFADTHARVGLLPTSGLSPRSSRTRALLASYHHIDDQQNSGPLWQEAAAAREWMKSASGDDIAQSRSAVIERGRSQVR